jgi:cyclohexa-1,5-dienecarbonyl-CoA hydratase
MSDLEFHKIDQSDGVARITLDRPKHNVLNLAMMRELNRLLETCEADATLKCLVIAGEGPSFCAGVEVADHKPDMAPDMIAVFNRMLALVQHMPVPVIAGVQGACLGGGMELAIACDIIVASEKALFGQPEIKLGFIPPYAAVRLPRLIGPAKAIEICTTGRRYTAAEAMQMGFVSHVVTADALTGKVAELSAEIQACSPLIIRLNKKAVQQHLELDFQNAVSSVSDLFLNEMMQTEDTLEGIASFEEKRKPVWKNK